MSEILQPGDRVGDGRYEIRALLGKGGFGHTYRALDTTTGVEVAIKALSLRSVSDWKRVELFEREARVLGTLSHPAIPRLLASFHEENGVRCFLVEDLVPGASLDARLKDGWQASPEEARSIAASVLDVLIYLGGLDPPVVHRDIKPSNLIQRPDGSIALIDFGAVRDTLRQAESVGSSAVGTFGYMAPEQVMGRSTPASDLYGLGATLAHLLLGLPPSELPHQKLKLDIRAGGQIPEALASWIDGLIQPAPEDRYGSARAALEHLPALDGSAGALAKTDERALSAELPFATRVRLEREGATLRVRIPGGKMSRSSALTALAFIPGSIIGMLIFLRAKEPQFFVFMLIPSLSSLPALYYGLRDWLTETWLTIGPREFRLERRFMGISKAHVGLTQSLSGVAIERQLRSVKGWKKDEEEPMACVLNEGALEHPFGERLSTAEREWLQQEITAHIQRSKKR